MVFRYTGELPKLDKVYEFIYHDYILEQNIDLEDRTNVVFTESPTIIRELGIKEGIDIK